MTVFGEVISGTTCLQQGTVSKGRWMVLAGCMFYRLIIISADIVPSNKAVEISIVVEIRKKKLDGNLEHRFKKEDLPTAYVREKRLTLLFTTSL